MNLEELKTSIENKTFNPCPLVLVDKDKFIALQYMEEIRKSLCSNIRYIESLDELSNEEDIFSDDTENFDGLTIFMVPLVDFSDNLIYTNNVIVITEKVNKASKEFYKDIIIEVPELTDWQIKDMVNSYCSGLDAKYSDWLISICNKDIHRLYNEILKLKIFIAVDQNQVFQEMCRDGAFDDISTNTVFNLTNAILKKDISTLKSIYEEIDNLDINGFGLLTILYNNFLSVINIQLGINPTAEKLGMKPNQFKAIKYNCGHYSASQLVNIQKFLTDIDRRIKSGEIDTSILVDYVLTSILSF